MSRVLRLEPAPQAPEIAAARRRLLTAAFVGAVVVGALAGALSGRAGL